jgi:hypothetical protein
MAPAHATGHVRIVDRKGGPVFYAKLRFRCQTAPFMSRNVASGGSGASGPARPRAT